MGGGGGGGHLKGIIEYMFYCVKGEDNFGFRIANFGLCGTRR
jgi:hypothetical protein